MKSIKSIKKKETRKSLFYIYKKIPVSSDEIATKYNVSKKVAQIQSTFA
nr:MAG TPA: hypothetical protein [Caudoviricetes sp.]